MREIIPEEIIKANLKILSKIKKSPYSENTQARTHVETHTKQEKEAFLSPFSGEANNNNPLKLEKILVHEASSDSMVSTTKQSTVTRGSQSYSHRDLSSVYVLEERLVKSSTKIINKFDRSNANVSQIEFLDVENRKKNLTRKTYGNESLKLKPEEKQYAKKKLIDDDRQRNAWIPCTCPQYKVSKELATKWDLQALFFGKILVVKVVQLMVINLAVFASLFDSNQMQNFYRSSHDWAYFAYVLFLALLICIRLGVTYRSRWPLAVSIMLMIPLTIIIAFTTACIATIHETVLIPTVTSTIFLTFIMLTFAPYLLRKSVMHRSTNLSGCILALLSSVLLLFLKEFEFKPMSYWEFFSCVWLPGVIISQIAVQITVFEIQRIIFGLSFNVSTRRWHVGALYI